MRAIIVRWFSPALPPTAAGVAGGNAVWSHRFCSWYSTCLVGCNKSTPAPSSQERIDCALVSAQRSLLALATRRRPLRRTCMVSSKKAMCLRLWWTPIYVRIRSSQMTGLPPGRRLPHTRGRPARTGLSGLHSAAAVMVFNDSALPDHGQSRDAWLTYLCQRQLTEVLGWQPADREYGGMGFAHGQPQTGAGELWMPLTESNLSATACALNAPARPAVPRNTSASRGRCRSCMLPEFRRG